MTLTRPGDKVLLVYAHTLADGDGDATKAKLESWLPGVEVFVLGGCSQVLVFRDPNNQADPDPDQTGAAL